MMLICFSWQSLMWGAVIIGQTMTYAAYSVLINMTKVEGIVPFHSSSLVLITESLKLVLCMVMITAQHIFSNKDKELFPSITMSNAAVYCVPALCYTFNNNLSVFMQTQMDPATYMVLGNMKTLSTGVLYQLIMKRYLTRIQWFSLALLTFGAAISSLSSVNSSVQSISEIYCTPLGLVLMACYCFISGFAGVFIEYQLKSTIELSLVHQNFLLYSFGILLNACVLFAQHLKQNWDSQTGPQMSLFSPLEGFSSTVWLIVITQSAVGLVMSIIVKYRSNLTRCFIISTAPLVTTFLSCLKFQLQVQPLFIFAVICVTIATLIYNLEKQIDFTNCWRKVSLIPTWKMTNCYCS